MTSNCGPACEVAARLLRARRAIAELAWKRRAEVIRRQLAEMRAAA